MATIEGHYRSEDEERLLAAAAAMLPDEWRVTLFRNPGARLVEIIVHAADGRRIAQAFEGDPYSQRAAGFLLELAREQKAQLVE